MHGRGFALGVDRILVIVAQLIALRQCIVLWSYMRTQRYTKDTTLRRASSRKEKHERTTLKQLSRSSCVHDRQHCQPHRARINLVMEVIRLCQCCGGAGPHSSRRTGDSACAEMATSVDYRKKIH